MIETSDDKAIREYIASPKCLLVWHADWCAPCKAMTPALEAFAATVDFPVVHADVDAYEGSLAEDVESIPCLRLYVDGELKDEAVGGMTARKLREKFGETR